ncbi:MAG: MBL fold metallo-hydrolase [Chloroflexota bacterium]|nr:MBL fold metallo-hydrolase [Chloroflexota bacterium]
MLDRIEWLGHGSFAIHTTPRIYINPRRVPRTDQHADLILLSHEHYDHFSPADVQKLRCEKTIVIGNDRIARELPDCTVLRPWQTMSFGRVCVKAVPAYSITDRSHARDNGGLGFVISVNYYDIYYAGDTERIPEMDQIRPDIALLPIDGRGTLTVSEAAQVARMMRPKWVMPFNYGASVSGATRLDAQRFVREVGEAAQALLPDAALAGR